MQMEEAEALAVQALAWIAADEDRLPVFLAATGADPGAIRAAAERPEFLRAVMEFITFDDRSVMEFCDAMGIDYQRPMAARQALSGPEMNWT